MHPRKLANNPASPPGKSRPRKRSSTSTSTGTPTLISPPNTTVTTTSNSPTQQHEPISPTSWHSGSVAAFGASVQSTGTSSGSFNFSSTTQPTSTSSSSSGFQSQPILPDRPRRTQSIPISFLINPIPQSPRPFAFSPAPSSPSPPPVEPSSAAVPLQIDPSSILSHQSSPQGRLASPTRPPAPFPRHHDLPSATSRSLSERRSYSTSSLPTLHTQNESSSLSTSTAEQTIRPVQDVGHHSAGSSIGPSTPSSKRPSVGGSGSPSKVSRIDTSSSATTDPLRPESTIGSKISRSRSRSSSSSKTIKDEQQRQQQVFATEELAPHPSPPRQVSLRRTTNPDLKTTKTGKILHKSKKAGVNKKSTAYNRFLRQQSKYLAKDNPDLTPQERMKLIAEGWAVSDKNTHTTRRRSRIMTEDNGQQQISSGPHLPSSSPLSPPPPPTSSSSSSSRAVTRSSSSRTTITTNISSSSSSSSSAITASSSSRSRSSRRESRSSIATPHDQSFIFSTTMTQEAGPLRVRNPTLLSTTTTTTTTTTTPRPADASAAMSQPTTRSSDCIPPLPPPVHRDEGDSTKDEYEE